MIDFLRARGRTLSIDTNISGKIANKTWYLPKPKVPYFLFYGISEVRKSIHRNSCCNIGSEI